AHDAWAQTRSFKTVGRPAIDNHNGVSQPGIGTARLEGNLIDGGLADLFLYWGERDGGTDPANWDNVTSVGNGSEGVFSAQVSNVIYGVCYAYRAYATNVLGEAWAGSASFFTSRSPLQPEPGDLPGLALWLDASALSLSNNAVVGVWPDRSGNDYHMDVLSGVGSDPRLVTNGLNGRPVVRYDGNDYQYTTHDFSRLGAHTIFSVARYTNPTGGPASQRIISARGQNWLFGFWNNADERWFSEGWIHQTGDNNTDWHVHAGTLSDDPDPRGAFWKDGVLLTTNSVGSNPPHAPRQITLGAWQNNTSEASEAEVAELIVFDRVLADNEMRLMADYLRRKYNLPLGFAPPNDFVDALTNLPATLISNDTAVLNATLNA
ncbi:MAG: hypothetical protein AAF492_29945, partial [Verrucomicrobiota bacterium]